ncbi:Retrovirus-related Pol polyprotein from transposon 17.6, partial [Mucuna pruriens]
MPPPIHRTRCLDDCVMETEVGGGEAKSGQGRNQHVTSGKIHAYSGYNQIRMHPQDESKTTFITDFGSFCYKVMPFGLKTVGATYKHLMNKIFKDVMGIDVEAYMDDMVLKSTTASEHYNALQRVFQILRRNQLKLNPEKSSFGVQAGKFLEFILTKRGIEANPEKCQAIIDMKNPQNVNKSIEVTLSIFQTPKKGGSFLWIAETEEAFQKMKAMLMAPLVLTRPTPSTPLVYLSVTDDAEGFPRSYSHFEETLPILPRLSYNSPN